MYQRCLLMKLMLKYQLLERKEKGKCLWANHSLTLRQERTNYQEFGACEKEMLEHCRKSRKSELK